MNNQMENGFVNNSLSTWLSALIGSASVALVGVLPLFIIPNEQNEKNGRYLEIFLSISVGSQLADVFLHLLPEAFAHSQASSISIGIWTLFGLLLFYFIDKMFPDENVENDYENVMKKRKKKNFNKPNKIFDKKIQTSGYLNLLANFIDNFSHGAAIGGSFSVSPFVGLTTLIAILIHEIPHELGDFAILLQSGFDRYQATKAQLITGSGALLGASFALFYSTTFQSTLWVLPFTSGAFLYVSLVKTLPHLLKENHLIHSFRQLFGLLLGFVIIYFIIYSIG